MIYDYTFSTGDATISGCILSGYIGQKDNASSFQDNFYYDSSLITGLKNMKLASNGQTLYEEGPIETAATNETIFQIFSGDIFLKTGAADEFDRNKIFGDPTTPFKSTYNIKYEKYTGKSAVGLGTAGASLGAALTSGISGFEANLTFIDYDYFLNGQKVYSGVGCGVSAGIGTQFILSFDEVAKGGIITSDNENNFKAFAFIKQDRINEVTGVNPDIYGTGFIEDQTSFYLNGVKESDDMYLEMYTGVTIIKTGVSAGVFTFASPNGTASVSL
tara:strand:+ start:652 stop:1473 length:822 start_codon:yes stop_codon:yes gene_type:complete